MTNKLKIYSTTPGSNNTASPDGWPEGQTAGSLNNGMREYAARVREWYEDPEWIDLGPTIVSSTGSTIVLSGDLTATYTAGRAIRTNQSATLLGWITSSSYSAPNTTVNVTGFTVAAPTQVEVGAITSQASLPNNMSITTGALTATTVTATSGAFSGTLTVGTLGSVTAASFGGITTGTITVSATATVSVLAGACIAAASDIASAAASKVVAADVLSKLATQAKAAGQWQYTTSGSGSGNLTALTSYNCDTATHSSFGNIRTIVIPFSTDMSNALYRHEVTVYSGSSVIAADSVTPAAGNLTVVATVANGIVITVNASVYGKRSDE